MELVPKDDCEILKANKFILQNMARAHVRKRERNGDECSSFLQNYFELSDAVLSCSECPSMKEWIRSLGLHFEVPESGLDICAVVFSHWASPSRKYVGLFECTGMALEIASAIPVNAGVSVELLDSCLSIVMKQFDNSILVLHARDIVACLEVIKKEFRHTSDLENGQCYPASGCAVTLSGLSLKKDLERFQNACSKNDRAKNSLTKMKTYVSENSPVLVVFPLFLESTTKRGNVSMGHWVTVEYALEYGKTTRTATSIVSNVYSRVGDSLAGSRGGFRSLKSEHEFLITALCAVCTSFVPHRVRSENLTLDRYPVGCGLPLQVDGNGCALYTLATIAAAKNRLELKRDPSTSTIDEDSILPFQHSFFDGRGEAGARAALAYIVTVRLYEYGRFVLWTRSPVRGLSLITKYIQWEKDQGTVATGTNVDRKSEVIFKGMLPPSTVSGINNTDSSSEQFRVRTITLCDSFLRQLTAGIRKYIPEFLASTGEEPCGFFKAARKTKIPSTSYSKTNGTRKIPIRPCIYATWFCVHGRRKRADGKVCRTALKIVAYPLSNSVEVQLTLRPPFKVSSALLPPIAHEDCSFPISEIFK